MLVVEELRSAEVVDYQTTLVAFVNCLVLGVSRLQTRASLRNEFIGESSLYHMQNTKRLIWGNYTWVSLSNSLFGN